MRKRATGELSLWFEVWRARLPLWFERQLFCPINKKRRAERKGGRFPCFASDVFLPGRKKNGPVGWWFPFSFFTRVMIGLEAWLAQVCPVFTRKG